MKKKLLKPRTVEVERREADPVALPVFAQPSVFRCRVADVDDAQKRHSRIQRRPARLYPEMRTISKCIVPTAIISKEPTAAGEIAHETGDLRPEGFRTPVP